VYDLFVFMIIRFYTAKSGQNYSLFKSNCPLFAKMFDPELMFGNGRERGVKKGEAEAYFAVR